MANVSIPVFVSSAPLSGQVLYKFKMNVATVLPANMAGTTTTCDTVPTAPATVTIKKNGASVGTVTFAVDGSSTFGGAGASYAVGDIFEMDAPNPADATLNNFSVNVFITAN